MLDCEGGEDGAKERKKTFEFSDSRTGETLYVAIPEVIDPAYGMYVWPCAPVLAQYIWFHRRHITTKKILELGAGTALPGVVAAKCGAQVMLSDSTSFIKCLENCERSCEVNGLENVKVIGLTWGRFTYELMSLEPVDVILGSDCFYNKKDFEDIIVTVSYLLEKNLDCQFWCTYQQRSSDWSIAHLLEKWKLTCHHVPLADFAADSPDLAGSNLPGDHTIQLLIIKKVNSVVMQTFT